MKKFMTCFEGTAAHFNDFIPELLVACRFRLLLVCLNPRLSSKWLRLTGGAESLQALAQTPTSV